MSWAEVSKVNGDFLNAPLDVKMHLADYKMYGEKSYVYQIKDLLHEVYDFVYLSMNDKTIIEEAFNHIISQNKIVGKAFAAIYGIDSKESFDGLNTLQAVLKNNTAVRVIIANQTAIQLFVTNSTALNTLASTQTAMQIIAGNSSALNAMLGNSSALNAMLGNSTALNALLGSNTAMNIIANNAEIMNAIISHPTAMNLIFSNTSAMRVISGSQTAMQIIAGSSTVSNALIANNSAFNIVIANTVAMQIIASNAMFLNLICKSQTASVAIKNNIQNATIRNIVLNTLNNATQYFIKTDTYWYHYDSTAGKDVKVVENGNNIVIPNLFTGHYNNNNYARLYYGADKSQIKEVTGMRDGAQVQINDVVSMRGLYFNGGPYAKTFATIFTAK
nr:MAG TPA: Tail fiber protein [Caudoviricetes sp.]